MEKKIGEIFEFEGEWYQCLKGISCRECDFSTNNVSCDIPGELLCTRKGRSDETSVVFKKLEKVGEPFACNYYGNNRLIMMQEYNLYNIDDVTNKDNIPMYINYKHKRIVIEIKQNKEEMVNKKTNFMEEIDALCKRYNMAEGVRADFIAEVKEIIKDENRECKLKPFDLEAAKAGKPVCTRDGRKARIICFDQEDIRPIVALIKLDKGGESAYYYYANGMNLSDNYQSVYDLMMLTEKKEGWVNVYMEETNSNERLAEQVIYKTRKDAFDNACPRGYKATVKIEWEE